ncbi:MAG: TlpA family protein disulfide reductase, partial [Pedobacter sp.]
MKIIITLLAVLMLDFPFSGVAQERSLVSIGDDMPPLKLSGLINSQTKEISITELKGKAVILDFGNTSCMPCLQALPSLSQLRDKFNGDLVVIMVSSEKKSNAEAFLKRRPDIKSLGIPIVTQDTLLKKYFPHLSI